MGSCESVGEVASDSCHPQNEAHIDAETNDRFVTQTAQTKQIEALTSLYKESQALQEQGKLTEAEPILRQALDDCVKQLGALHPQTLARTRDYGRLLQEQGKLPEAETFYYKALEGMQASLGTEHLDTLSITAALARLLQQRGESGEPEKLLEAEPFYRRVMLGCERQLGRSHAQTASAIFDLAELQEVRGRDAGDGFEAALDEANELYARELQIFEELYGASHEQTEESRRNLARFRKAYIDLDSEDE